VGSHDVARRIGLTRPLRAQTFLGGLKCAPLFGDQVTLG
jgi:hypothetical protein